MQKYLAALLLSLIVTLPALALTPYTKDEYEAAQRNNEKILLYFHADWCPNCVAMKKALTELEAEGEMKDFKTFIVDFDKDKEVMKRRWVKHQSTVLSQIGYKETGRGNMIKQKEELKKYFVTTKLKDSAK